MYEEDSKELNDINIYRNEVCQAIINIARYYNLHAYYTSMCNAIDDDHSDLMLGRDGLTRIVGEISILLLKEKFDINKSDVSHLISSYNTIVNYVDFSQLHEVIDNEYTNDDHQDSYYNDVLSQLKGIEPIKVNDDITLYSKKYKLHILHDLKNNVLYSAFFSAFPEMIDKNNGMGLSYYYASKLLVKCFNTLTKSNFNGDVMIGDYDEMCDYEMKYCRKYARKSKLSKTDKSQ